MVPEPRSRFNVNDASKLISSLLGGATGSKDFGFIPGRGDGFLRAIKVRSTPSFG